MMQQNSYMNHRCLRWFLRRFTKKSTAYPQIISFLPILPLLLASCLASLLLIDDLTESFSYIFWRSIYVLWIITYGKQAFLILKKPQKKKLVFTKRAVRLLLTSLVLYVSVIMPILFFHANQPILFLSLLIVSILSPVFIILANWLLIPIEQQVNHWYFCDAAKILARMPQLQIIGITGSYGKTSVKYFLTSILSERFNVLMTPGSYNTTMGVVKTIRTYLRPIHEIFVVEMGARRVGDIREICNLTKPQISILTAVGPQHLETFGSLSNVQRGKFEIVDTLSPSGLAVLNADYKLIRTKKLDADAQVIYYGTEEKNSNYYARDIHYNDKGMSFKIYQKDSEVLFLQTSLLGKHNASNILCACIVALTLGIDKNTIAYAVRKLKPVAHRLEIKNIASGIIIIDDAFNANPQGAKMALEVLANMKGNKKIIITPGMIELGESEYEHNKAFGKLIAHYCDYAILVGHRQTYSICQGLGAAAYSKDKYYLATDLTDANRHLKQVVSSGDVVLYENDLPDAYDE